MIPWRNLKRFFQKAIKQPGYALRVFGKRLKANIYYFWGNGRSGYPEAITLFLTHRCNLHCKMCGQWGEGGITKKQSTQYIQAELTLNESKSIIDDMAPFKPNVTLFGGEPLLYQGCVEIINYIKQKRMHCLMITNGFLLGDLAEKIVDAGLDELNVSLDGDVQLHDQIRGMPGLFDKIMGGLKQINYFKIQKNKKKPLLNLQCTITQYNYKYLEQMTNVANRAQADSLTFHNLIFLNRELLDKQKIYDSLLSCTSIDWEGFLFEAGIEPQILHEKMKHILSAKYRFSVDFYPNFSYKELLEYYKNLEFMPPDYSCRCLSPWIAAYVFPDGEVKPCLNSSYSFGNLRKNRLLKVWNSEQAVRFRRLLKKKRIFPVCIRCTELYRY